MSARPDEVCRVFCSSVAEVNALAQHCDKERKYNEQGDLQHDDGEENE